MTINQPKITGYSCLFLVLLLAGSFLGNLFYILEVSKPNSYSLFSFPVFVTFSLTFFLLNRKIQFPSFYRFVSAIVLIIGSFSVINFVNLSVVIYSMTKVYFIFMILYLLTKFSKTQINEILRLFCNFYYISIVTALTLIFFEYLGMIDLHPRAIVYDNGHYFRFAGLGFELVDFVFSSFAVLIIEFSLRNHVKNRSITLRLIPVLCIYYAYSNATPIYLAVILFAIISCLFVRSSLFVLVSVILSFIFLFNSAEISQMINSVLRYFPRSDSGLVPGSALYNRIYPSLYYLGVLRDNLFELPLGFSGSYKSSLNAGVFSIFNFTAIPFGFLQMLGDGTILALLAFFSSIVYIFRIINASFKSRETLCYACILGLCLGYTITQGSFLNFTVLGLFFISLELLRRGVDGEF